MIHLDIIRNQISSTSSTHPSACPRDQNQPAANPAKESRCPASLAMPLSLPLPQTLLHCSDPGNVVQSTVRGSKNRQRLQLLALSLKCSRMKGRRSPGLGPAENPAGDLRCHPVWLHLVTTWSSFPSINNDLC